MRPLIRRVSAVFLVLALTSCDGDGTPHAEVARTADAVTTLDADSAADAVAPGDAAATDGGVRAGCTCLTPAEWNFVGNACEGPTYRFGCRESPQEGPRLFDVPPACWRRTTVDPATGCLKPDPMGCRESCWRPAVGADAGPPEDARPLDGT
jgi:hypothetical protein